jgi:hypothetical protein
MQQSMDEFVRGTALQQYKSSEIGAIVLSKRCITDYSMHMKMDLDEVTAEARKSKDLGSGSNWS